MSKKKAPAKGKEISDSAEQKIIEAARKLFMQKGYSATKTRDIAAEAGINLALLNYYFRSKEKLFEMIMIDNFRQFIGVIVKMLNDESTTLENKIKNLVATYIDLFLQNGDLPLFILTEIRNHPEKLMGNLPAAPAIFGSVFMRQLQEAIEAKKIPPMDPRHLMLNVVGLTIFPFAAQPMLQAIAGLGGKQFEEMMLERKELIPAWIQAMLKKS
jgi:AcrR family transcriptional regulator